MQSTIRKHLRTFLFSILVGLFGSGLLVAQGTTGSLSGQITDPSGAAVPAASITLTNAGTNLTLTGKSDSTGVYLSLIHI